MDTANDLELPHVLHPEESWTLKDGSAVFSSYY